jgi:diguanylate cyclase (GGDEF)-like protein/PAS domain S-box-containing protein
MLRNAFQRNSLKTRVTVLTLLIFLVSVWSVTFYTSAMLRRDMRRLLGEQQFSTASMVASEIDQELQERVRALHEIASELTPSRLVDPAALQASLEHHPVFRNLFNAGAIVTGPDGVAIASVPASAQRRGIGYLDRAYIAGALRNGKATIGPPLLSRPAHAPGFGMAVPIRDSQSQVIGAVAGLINLTQPNFLDRVSESRYGKTGNYLLIDQQQRLIIAASDKRRIMEALPAPGVNPTLDRFMRGYDGTEIYVNSQGVEVLSAAKGVTMANWHVAVALPTADAFAPVNELLNRMLLATLVLTVLTAALIWWMLRYQLAPLEATARALSSLPGSKQPMQPLMVVRNDEIGQLINAFNRLLADLAQRQEGLRESEERYHTAFLTSPDAVNLTRLEDGLYLDVNEGFANLTGWTREEVIGKTSQEINVWHDMKDRQRLVEALQRNGSCKDLRADFVTKQGGLIAGLMSAHVMTLNGRPCILSVTRDITAREAAEHRLQESEGRYRRMVENSPDIVYAFSLSRGGLYYSPKVLEVLGYSPEHLCANPLLWAESIHPDDRAVVATAIEDFQAGTPFRIEYRLKNSRGAWLWLFDRSIGSRQQDGDLIVEGLAMDITDRKLAEEEIQSLAFSDPLTGLANRRLLLDRLQQALATGVRHRRHGALLLIDLDNFKTLNDTLGHHQGDLLLQQVGKRLLACIQEGDTVARLGGDEFVVMLEDLGENRLEAATQAELMAERISTTLNRIYELKGFGRHSTPSIGITLFGDESRDMDEVLKRADLAMYQAKAAGRNTLRFFDPQMQAVVTARAALEAGLHEAILQQQFLLHYQPQVTSEGRVTGVEALLRWQDPQRGMMKPGNFIPLAEETGFILPLGRWVLETACAQLASWARQSALADLSLAVNVSARQFHQADFADQVLTILERTGARAERLKLELTETVLITNVEDVIAKMQTLKARGVGFSLDDFGTGYSSLSYLKRLPLDQLKIDQGFVRDILIDPDDAAIARMVIALGSSMGLKVVAEGVETQAQCDFLAGLGCHHYQGYLFSPPLPLEEIEAFVRGR